MRFPNPCSLTAGCERRSRNRACRPRHAFGPVQAVRHEPHAARSNRIDDDGETMTDRTQEGSSQGSYSHPEAPVRHSYPLAIGEAGLGTAVSLMSQTLPYALVRFAMLLAFSIATIIWFVVVFGIGGLLAAGVHPWIGFGWWVAGFGAYGWAWLVIVRYALYLLQAGHIAVLTELITTGKIGSGSEGMFQYGKRIVTERFGQVNVLFALDLLVRGVVQAFNRTLNWVAGVLPIPGMQSIAGIVTAIVRAATTYIDETILSYNLARGDENAWRSSKDALIYYCQNSKEILKTAVWVVVIDKVLTAAIWVVMLLPAFLLLAVLPAAWAPGGFIAGLVIAALFASNIRQAFLKPVFLIMVMTKFHVQVRNQQINLEWDQRLTSVSDKFRQIKDKAAAGWAPAPQAGPGTLPAGNV
jgi:hypothetical protein